MRLWSWFLWFSDFANPFLLVCVCVFVHKRINNSAALKSGQLGVNAMNGQILPAHPSRDNKTPQTKSKHQTNRIRLESQMCDDDVQTNVEWAHI